MYDRLIRFFFVPYPGSSNQTTFGNITRDFVIPHCSAELAIPNGVGKMETVQLNRLVLIAWLYGSGDRSAALNEFAGCELFC